MSYTARITRAAGILAIIVGTAFGSVASAASDFGALVQTLVFAHSSNEFDIVRPLDRSSDRQISAAEALADPTALVTLASPLRARVVATPPSARVIDMIALWPDEVRPTHLIACNESGVTETIVTGTSSCDPAHRSPWGTILFGEEAGGGANGGRVYELLDPLHTTNVVLNRATGAFTGGQGAANLVARPALGRLSFEGIGVYPNGVVYYGDEQRPASGTPGGAYFKFIPSTLRDPSAGPITSLSQSPLVSGSVYGLRLGLRSGATDYGQGTQTGFGRWVPIPSSPDPDLRAQAAALKLTGYYRPEDLAIDKAAQAEGRVRWCANNTGNESDDENYGETLCLTDGTIAESATSSSRGPVPGARRSGIRYGRQHCVSATPW
jgi:hypothetical protein